MPWTRWVALSLLHHFWFLSSLQAYDEWDYVTDYLSANPRQRLQSDESNASVKSTTAIAARSLDRRESELQVPSCDVGQSVWVGLNCILSQILALTTTPTYVVDQGSDVESSVSIIDIVFSSSLAALQHFLKRFPESVIVMKSALSGYVGLAKTCIPIDSEYDIQRKAILTSLSKSCLSPFGRNKVSR